MKDREILYLTFDGLGSPLGYSQVVRPLIALAQRGFRYRVLSMEHEADLADPARVARVRAALTSHGVAWDALPYGPDRADNVRRMLARAARLPRPRLVHCRSYLAGVVGLALRARWGTPYLFDARGYWVDERLAQGAWFNGALRLGAARFVEHRLYRNARAIVMLTDVGADDVRRHVFGRWTGVPVVTIPTCVDYDEFALRFDADVAQDARPLAGRLVLGHLGSINASYRIDVTLDLSARVLRQRADAHLLCLTPQIDEMRRLVAEHGVDPGRVTVRSVDHDRVAPWVRAMDWGLMLLESSFAKRGSMPTKLAELFASGVRPVAHGCNDDVRRWVERAGTGITLPDLDERSVARAADAIVRGVTDEGALRAGRELTRPHFDLGRGADAYAALIGEILG
ncbi:MAG: glycosyltransferase [Sandaracinaceae bacterium]|nr:glycosyltransferase [Sandaracinaceae bacterium]